MLSQIVVVNPDDYRKVYVLGDLHGDSRALGALLGTVDLEGDLLVFLGDYADRGPDGVGVIRKIGELREMYPRNVVALKGNHEDYSETGVPNFSPCTLINEAEAKLGSWDRYFREELKPFIDTLPLCALIPNNALLVHGGISSKITGINVLQEPSEELRIDLRPQGRRRRGP